MVPRRIVLPSPIAKAGRVVWAHFVRWRVWLGSLLAGGWGFWRRKWAGSVVAGSAGAAARLLLGSGWGDLLGSLAVAALAGFLYFVGCVVWARFNNPDWTPDIHDFGDEIYFTLVPTKPLRRPKGMSGRCIVRVGDQEYPSDVLPVYTDFTAEYPLHFPGAPPVVPGGRYTATWFLAGKREDRPSILLRRRYRVPDQAASA